MLSEGLIRVRIYGTLQTGQTIHDEHQRLQCWPFPNRTYDGYNREEMARTRLLTSSVPTSPSDMKLSSNPRVYINASVAKHVLICSNRGMWAYFALPESCAAQSWSTRLSQSWSTRMWCTFCPSPPWIHDVSILGRLLVVRARDARTIPFNYRSTATALAMAPIVTTTTSPEPTPGRGVRIAVPCTLLIPVLVPRPVRLSSAQYGGNGLTHYYVFVYVTTHYCVVHYDIFFITHIYNIITCCFRNVSQWPVLSIITSLLPHYYSIIRNGKNM